MFSPFTKKSKQEAITIITIARRKGITNIDDLERILKKEINITTSSSNPKRRVCPSCGKGRVVRKRREMVSYEVCKYPVPKENDVQGCGWSRRVK